MSRLLLILMVFVLAACQSETPPTEETPKEEPNIVDSMVVDDPEPVTVDSVAVDTVPVEPLRIGGNPMQVYLDDPGILSVAKDYYNGKYEVSAEPNTQSIIDAVGSCTDAQRPFYVQVFNKIIADADDDLGEWLGAPAKELIQDHPQELSAFGAASAKEWRKTKAKWVELVGFEFVLADDPALAFATFKENAGDNCSACSEDEKAFLNALLESLQGYVDENAL